MTNELTTAHRQLHTSILEDPGSTQRAARILAALPGVKEAKPNASGKCIRVCYDVTKLQYPALIHALETEGLIKKTGWWERVRCGWYSDQDCITRDNARAKPSPCCSNPTSILAQSGDKKHR